MSIVLEGLRDVLARHGATGVCHRCLSHVLAAPLFVIRTAGDALRRLGDAEARAGQCGRCGHWSLVLRSPTSPRAETLPMTA